jgi:hypothetical protein
LPPLERGNHSIVAVATDISDVSTSSAPITIKVSTIPKVSLVTPTDAARFPELSNVSVIARADQQVDEVRKVDLFVNGKFMGSMRNDDGPDVFRFIWRSPRAGVYALTVVATNPMGVTGESATVKIVVVGSQRKN